MYSRSLPKIFPSSFSYQQARCGVQTSQISEASRLELLILSLSYYHWDDNLTWGSKHQREDEEERYQNAPQLDSTTDEWIIIVKRHLQTLVSSPGQGFLWVDQAVMTTVTPPKYTSVIVDLCGAPGLRNTGNIEKGLNVLCNFANDWVIDDGQF